MKHILITGANSYIGTSFEKWIAKWPEKYSVDTVDVRDESWKQKDFSRYDVVFHVAGIAHVKETRTNRALYYKVNRDLAFEVARKARAGGVRQFIFLSSMSVFGVTTGIITSATVPSPKTHYGRSKLEAERLLAGLESNEFKVAIVRPPMVYGNGCRGNYPRLSKLAKLTPFFPTIANERSVIYIDNLTEIVRWIIDDLESGVFHPQNGRYASTKQFVEQIALLNTKKVLFTGVLNGLIKICMRLDLLGKVFGTLVYDMDMSTTCDVLSFEESVVGAEGIEFSLEHKGGVP